MHPVDGSQPEPYPARTDIEFSYMIKTQQATLFLQQLEQQYPRIFKRNFLLYGQIKAKGMLDDYKEFIPWGLAVMIFVSTAFALDELISMTFPQFEGVQSFGIGILIIMLFLMTAVPFIIKQIKHSSTHLYQQLSNTPLKLAVLIILQTVNIAFVQSSLLQSVLFFLALSFGFVKFYKENMFREASSDMDYYNLQQVRRACLWSYKQTLKARAAMKFIPKDSDKFSIAEQHLAEFLELHLKLIKYENELSRTNKFTDLDEYVDSLM